MPRFPQSLSLPADIIPACWILFSVIWLLAAATNKRSIYRESGAQRLRYLILLVLAFLLLTKRHRLPYPLDVRIISATETVEWMAGILCIAGLAFCVWARATLGRNWSGTITLKEGHELIDAGRIASSVIRSTPDYWLCFSRPLSDSGIWAESSPSSSRS
jgi:protein-S-isoprenylcysteine O-methyltransferase Ste14